MACAFVADPSPNRTKTTRLLHGGSFAFTPRAREMSRMLGERSLAICAIGDDSYPVSLRDLPDPPAFLLVHGAPIPPAPIISIAAPLYGTATSWRDGVSLVRLFSGHGFAVAMGDVSVMERNLAKAVLDSGGRAIIVTDNLDKEGWDPRLCVLSPFLPGSSCPSDFHHSLWNIVTGLSQLTVLIPPPTGTVMSRFASEALDIGRDVFLLGGSGPWYEGGWDLYQSGCPVFPLG
ncbi:MAG: DNA-protecting protein DprA [Sphaerochaeta sp.]|nr:DNA-protecting protein DprA [Sphaerochaeta sp.]MCH3921028.1 DNA-protecting protein DprA [Sphaerochaeta sp.]MCI2045330.1 DNA-protecting protein DprA [Sphaerochaeta sp.]MCI2076473.1 DNA-protecting protein DprA [Sphaerochaeta sp.]MCI2097059.1 DNA-protecting protein DprA [Sphaerochaeta sp.]